MKRLLVLLMIVGLIAGAVSTAEAGKKKKKKKKNARVEREAQGSYSAPATAVGLCTQTDGVGCMAFMSGAGEKFITAKVTDTHGQPVSILVSADLDGDGSTETSYGSFCGSTEEPLKIDPGVELIFWVGRADVIATSQCVVGAATQGTMDVTFSNKP